ncbi:MAG: universal stress protein, partial [Desulfobacteraceae bacterium]
VIRQNEEYIYDDSTGKGEAVPGEEVMDHVFKKACHKFEQAGVKPEHIHRRIISGSRSRAGTIADVALENNHNIIFVGRHGVSKVKDFFLGRVSKKLIYAASKKTVCIV